MPRKKPTRIKRLPPTHIAITGILHTTFAEQGQAIRWVVCEDDGRLTTVEIPSWAAEMFGQVRPGQTVRIEGEEHEWHGGGTKLVATTSIEVIA
ncbi:MAG: hypothetical protein Fur005_43020 [Roseiflexaceae bacterium]